MGQKVGGVAVLALLVLGGLGMIFGGVWTYLDEHSGTKTTAHVTECQSTGSGKGANLFCYGTWVKDGRKMTGLVENGRRGDVGKDVSVRLHGHHAAKPALWVSIALAVFGLPILGFGLWLTVRVLQLKRRRATDPAPA